MYLTWLGDAARASGLAVVESAGWQTRGHGPMALCEGVVGHHTATAASAKGDYPSLNVVTAGRSDLAGPLCNVGLGRNGTVYVVAAGCAWHAGVSSFAGFTSLNDKFIGIEAENPGDGKWTSAQLDAYPRLVAALLKHMGRGSDRYVSHRVCALPAGRKVDPTGITDTWMRGQVDVILRGNGPAPTDTPWLALPTLTYGETSAGVMALQRFLVGHYKSYAKFTPTGFYGNDTRATMAEFQRRVGITGPDAIGTPVGPRTKQALWAEGFRG